ncbi:adenosine deaminase [Alteromonas sp. AMM-1]|uniref:adenosine deaminase n=1 Tax=Alteromonas sp. AMM-1 TaxID=3394233 RepID=UPI0039A61721
MSLIKLIETLPKTELHLHIEGSLEPSMMWELASKHGVTLPYDSVEAIEAAYQFDDLQSFLDLYYQGADVLRDEDDFYLLMMAYLQRCRIDNVVHAEIMFDPQTHTSRGVGFDVFMPGFNRAITEAKQQWGMSVYLIMSFLRHLPEKDAIDTLNQAREYYPMIKAVGLDSSELGNPPENFVKVFAASRALGFKCVAHAGEEGPPEYIWQALDLLHVDRIDHGVRSSEDAVLMQRLKDEGMPLTVCPQSNIKLCVFDHMKDHNILELLDDDVCVTVNADDPSYFGGYLNDNYRALMTHLAMNEAQLVRLVKNSFVASFLPADEKNRWLREIDKLVGM